MESVENRQTKDRIADLLREEILSGRIEDGQELAQEHLAQLLEVSRMPVREALQLLELEGFLLRLPSRRVRVVGRSPQAVQENLRLVGAVEAEIALMLLEGPHPLEPAKADPADDHRFHRWISDQSNNPYLRQVHRRLLQGYPDYLWRHAVPGAFADRNRRIQAALESGDPTAVRREITLYYQDLAKTLPSHGEELTLE